MKSLVSIVVDIAALVAVRLLACLMSVLPECAAFFVARSVVYLVGLGMPRIYSVGVRNLEIAFPEKSEAERKKIFDESLDVLAWNLLTFSKLSQLVEKVAEEVNSDELQRAVANSQQQAKAKGKGVLWIGVHYGCFELCVQSYCVLFGSFSILAREFGLERLDAWWNGRRERYGHKIFGRKGGYRELISRLNRGEKVVILPDQNVKAKHAVFVDFFGNKASFTKTPALVALRTGAPVVFSAVSGTPKTGFQSMTYEISTADLESVGFEEKVQALSQRIASVQEEVIRKHPENWFWVHRRWKTRPPGEAEMVYQKRPIKNH